MGIFGSVSVKLVDEFAKGLAQQLARQCPPDGDKTDHGQRVTPKKLVAVTEDMFRQAAAFNQEHRLGIYKKARLGNTFRWELVSLGYEKPFAEDVTRRLILQLSARKAKDAKKPTK